MIGSKFGWKVEVWELTGTEGGGSCLLCSVQQCDGGFMKVLYCGILGKLDPGCGILAFLNSCVDRRGAGKYLTC